MTPQAFRNAVAKGHGRAILALTNGEIDPPLSTMRALVLRWQGFDTYFEVYRGVYCADLIEASRYAEELTTCLYQMWVKKRGHRAHSNQRLSTVLELAKRGDARARALIYAAFDPNHEDFQLCDEIIELDGIAGLEWVLERVQGRIHGDDLHQLYVWKMTAEAREGEERVAAWLAMPINADYVAGLEALDKANKSRPKRRKERPLSFDQLKGQKRMKVRRWGHEASDEDIAKAAAEFLVATDPTWLETLQNALRLAPEFLDVDAVLKRAESWSGDINPFFEILEHVTDERVRLTGLAKLNEDLPVAFSLLRHNSKAGDETPMLSALTDVSEIDLDDLHGIVMDILFAADRDDCESTALLLWAYEMSPCSECRNSAVRRLLEKGAMPEPVLRECLWDAEPDTREVARTVLAAPPR